jgi:hypothetical protein
MVLATSTLFAQGERRGGRGGFGLPEVGSKVPAIEAFDENGRKFRLDAKLGEKYTVLVFGCLT